MSVVSPIPHGRRSPSREPRLTVEWLAREVNDSGDFADRAHDVLSDRVTALEEIILAGWLRGMFLRRRLRRALRASVAGYDDLSPDFRHRRAEWASEQVILSRRRFDQMHGGRA